MAEVSDIPNPGPGAPTAWDEGITIWDNNSTAWDVNYAIRFNVVIVRDQAVALTKLEGPQPVGNT